MMVSQDLHRVSRTLGIMASVTVEHDVSEHILMAYGVVLLCQ
jgi:hypothetical protein